MTRERDADDVLSQGMRAGEQRASGQGFDAHRQRLRRVVQLRLDRRLQGRIDASDVVQQAFIHASRRLAEYAANLRRAFHSANEGVLRANGEQRLSRHRAHRRPAHRNCWPGGVTRNPRLDMSPPCEYRSCRTRLVPTSSWYDASEQGTDAGRSLRGRAGVRHEP
jgi:hypothetical protein